MELSNGLTIGYQVTKEEREFLWDSIIEYNKSTGPMLAHPPYEPFSIIIKDESNNIMAGILTKIYLKCVFVELLWVSDKHRKGGFGSKLLSSVEKAAKKKRCSFIHLDTFSFQAIDFYLKYGYEVFGVIEDYPDEIKRYFLKKYL
jgi:GNAT superfamily N-acetyltransferase